jgi:hypothetical protein
MRTLLVLAGALAASVAMAQSATDVPDNHWASKAVSDLYRLGILRGYPDGQFRGSRPVSRYELAQALGAFYRVQKDRLDGLSADLTRVSGPQQNVEGLALIRTRLDALEMNVASFKPGPGDISDLRVQFGKMTEQLRKLQEDLRIMRNKRQ